MGRGRGELVPCRQHANVVVIVLGAGATSRYGGGTSGLGRWRKAGVLVALPFLPAGGVRFPRWWRSTGGSPPSLLCSLPSLPLLYYVVAAHKEKDSRLGFGWWPRAL